MLGASLQGRSSKQPPKRDGDDDLHVANVRSGTHLRIDLTRDGDPYAGIVISEHNAWALFGILAVFLNVPLSAAARARFER